MGENTSSNNQIRTKEQVVNQYNSLSDECAYSGSEKLTDVYHSFVTENIESAGYRPSRYIKLVHKRQIEADNWRKPAGLMIDDMTLITQADNTFQYPNDINTEIMKMYSSELSEMELREKKWNSLIESYEWAGRRHCRANLSLDLLIVEIAKVLIGSELTPPDSVPLDDFHKLKQDIDNRIRSYLRS